MEADHNFVNKEILEKRKKQFEELMKRRFFFAQGSEIYKGVAGFYDFGPPGCAIRNNIMQLWREHFILEDDMLEIASTCLMPEKVWEASGHLKRFTDLLVRDVVTKQGYRADKLIEEEVDRRLLKNTQQKDQKKKLTEEQIKELQIVSKRADGMTAEETNQVIKQYNFKAPDTGNDLTEAEPFNLMFHTQIGPSSNSSGYFRPELAQGMFVNFPKLYDFNFRKLPFGAAQIGLGFRNEIAPRSGLLRVREFDMMEIEFFFDPESPNLEKFHKYANCTLRLLSAARQDQKQFDAVETPLKVAVETGLISNQIHAYYIYRAFLFLKNVGVNENNIRFRQHRKNEMAHYSKDTWDAEVETSHGWIEVAGLANRSAFDLQCHLKHSGEKKLMASRRLKQSKNVTETKIHIDKSKIGKELKKDGGALIKYLENIEDEAERNQLKQHLEQHKEKVLNIENKEIKLTLDMVKFEVVNYNIDEEKFYPWVVEPSFGLGRIFVALLEHRFRQKESKDGMRSYLVLPPKIAPVKVSILPLVNRPKYFEFIDFLKSSFIKSSISSKVDKKDNIGRRYARTDELGIPFAVTIDEDTFKDKTVTLREVSTTKQVRIKIEDVVKIVWELSEQFITWEDVLNKYPLFEFKIEEHAEEEKDEND